MKLVLAAPTIYYGQPELGPSYEYHHFFNSLVACGHDVTMVDTFGKGSTQVVLQACESADLLIVVPNSDELDWPLLKKVPCATLAILSDDQWRREYGLSIAPHFDYIMAQAPDSAAAYGAKFLPFEWAVWEGLYTQTDGPRDIPVAFLGQLYGDRGEYLYRLMSAGVPCLVQGYGFPKQIHSTDIHKLMQRVQIGLSFSRSSDRSCFQIKTRPFETCAAGALLICEHAPGIEALLTPDVEAVFFTTAQEMVDAVNYYLTHPDEAARIAAAGRQRVLQDHTYAKRWEVLKQVTLKPKSTPIHKPFISVLIPAYNAEKTIKRAIRSAFNQAGCNIEVVVCDDGSTDHTAQFAKDAGATVISQPNAGVSDAIQTAADHASGEYLIVLGADDWYEANSLIMLAKALRDGADFAYGATKYWGVKSDVYVPEPYTPFEFYQHNASLYAYMFKREALQKASFHTFDGGGPEDWDFVLQLIEAGCSGRAVRTVIVLNHVHHKGTLTDKAKTDEATRQLMERHPLMKGATA